MNDNNNIIKIESNDTCFWHDILCNNVGCHRTKCSFRSGEKGLLKNLVCIDTDQMHILYNVMLKCLFERKNSVHIPFIDSVKIDIMGGLKQGSRKTRIVCSSVFKHQG